MEQKKDLDSCAFRPQQKQNDSCLSGVMRKKQKKVATPEGVTWIGWRTSHCSLYGLKTELENCADNTEDLTLLLQRTQSFSTPSSPCRHSSGEISKSLTVVKFGPHSRLGLKIEVVKMKTVWRIRPVHPSLSQRLALHSWTGVGVLSDHKIPIPLHLFLRQQMLNSSCLYDSSLHHEPTCFPTDYWTFSLGCHKGTLYSIYPKSTLLRVVYLHEWDPFYPWHRRVGWAWSLIALYVSPPIFIPSFHFYHNHRAQCTFSWVYSLWASFIICYTATWRIFRMKPWACCTPQLTPNISHRTTVLSDWQGNKVLGDLAAVFPHNFTLLHWSPFPSLNKQGSYGLRG